MLKVKYVNNIAIVSFKTEKKLNITIADEIKKDLLHLINHGVLKIIVDFQGITFIDSSGFAILISSFNYAKENNCQFKIGNISKEVAELLEVTKLNTVFDICGNIEDCIHIMS